MNLRRPASADDVGFAVPDLGRVHGDGDGTGHGRSASVRSRYVEGEDGAGVQRPGKERLVLPLVIQEERDGSGREVGDPFFRITVHQARLSRLEIKHAVRVGGKEVRGYLEPDACVLQGAVEADRHDRASLDYDHLFVPVKRPGEARGREFDGTDAHRVTACIHQQGFGRFPVRSLVEYLPVRVAHAEDEVVRVRDFGRCPGPRPLAFDDPAEFPLSLEKAQAEVVARTDGRCQRHQCPKKFESHSYEPLTAGHRARPSRN